MKRPPEMSRAQFRKALERNGFRQVLLWINDTTGAVPGTSWGMLLYRNGKSAYRATLAHVIRERELQIKRNENSIRSPGFRNPNAPTVQELS
jgi:hypothetical protein